MTQWWYANVFGLSHMRRLGQTGWFICEFIQHKVIKMHHGATDTPFDKNLL